MHKNLRVLALQWNCLRSTDGIEQLSELRSLDLGFNFIAVISEVVRLSGDCASGCPFSCPSSVCTSSHMPGVGEQWPRDIYALPGLASLSSLRLAGNPVAYARSYRCDVLSCFPPPQQHAIRLDGGVANSHERQRLRRRTSGSGGRIAQVPNHCHMLSSVRHCPRSQRAQATQLRAVLNIPMNGESHAVWSLGAAVMYSS